MIWERRLDMISFYPHYSHVQLIFCPSVSALRCQDASYVCSDGYHKNSYGSLFANTFLT